MDFSTRQSRAAAEQARLNTGFTNGLSSGSLETEIPLTPGSPSASGPPLSPR
jgi:hypothetical protein